jgi:branched-chain amino acid transport system substrate-binding protein
LQGIVFRFTLHTSLKVKLTLPLTGYLAHEGRKTHIAIELAAEMINEGGIKSMGGAKIKPVVADFESKPVAAIQAEKLCAAQGCLFLTERI